MRLTVEEFAVGMRNDDAAEPSSFVDGDYRSTPLSTSESSSGSTPGLCSLMQIRFAKLNIRIPPAVVTHI